MSALGNLTNEKVFKYFEKICSIPHGSGHIEAISDYLCSFAKENGLEYIKDGIGNVVIFKSATAGYENKPGVILQGHMDMVLAVEKGYEDSIDMLTTPLDLFVEDDLIGARHTTLGGDDGIAVAMALAVLASDDISHPALEVIVTVDEEVGMDGASYLDPELIRYNRLINIDNEVEGQIITGCAGGGRMVLSLPMDVETTCVDNLRFVKILVDGCKGGHSGVEIHHGRANANMLVGRILYELTNDEKLHIKLVDISGGTADNAIPPSAYACVAIEDREDCYEKLCSYVKELEQDVRSEYASVDSNISISVETVSRPQNNERFSDEATRKLANLIWAVPNGVMAMSADVPGLVETSLNLGILELADSTVRMHFAVRSSVETSKRAVIDKLSAISELAGAQVSLSGLYPGWKYEVDSPLRDTCINLYKKMFGKEPTVEAIHAGLECGFFMSKRSGMDCVSIGPDIYEIHTPRERLSISSTRRSWEYLIEILKKI